MIDLKRVLNSVGAVQRPLLRCLYALFAIASILVLGNECGLAQFRQTPSDAIPAFSHSGNRAMNMDAFTSQHPDLSAGMDQAATTSEPGKKNVFLAAVLSLAVPGLGEYYVGDQIWRGMIFSGLEVGLWAERFHWQHRYDDSGAAFYAFNSAHWDTAKYVRSLDTLLVQNHVDPNCNCFADTIDINSLNRAIAKLDSLASNSSDPFATNDYTHRLAVGDPQQWNELISKYTEFVAGWDEPGNFTRAGQMRANWNDQAGIADAFLYAIFLNHLLSAVDAALLASDHNSRIHLQGSIIRRPNANGEIGYAPTARVEIRF